MTSMRCLGCGLLLLAVALGGLAQDTGKTRRPGESVYTYDFLLGKELVARYHMNDYSKPIFWPVHAPGGQCLPAPGR